MLNEPGSRSPYCSFIRYWQTLPSGSGDAGDCHGGRRLVIPNGRRVGVRGPSVDLCWLNVRSGGFKSSGLIYFFWDKAAVSDWPFRSSITQAAQPYQIRELQLWKAEAHA